MTPLIDIVFQLLLFFILTAAVSQPSLTIDLPEAGAQASEDIETEMTVSIDAKGNYFLNNVPASIAEIQKQMMAIGQGNSGLPVMLMADKQAAYGAVFAVLEIAEEAGLTNINLAYREAE
jgi:biopolymer transport protein ExbD